MRAVVSGASGFLGVHLIDELLRRGWTIFGVIRPNSPNASRLPEHENFHAIELDIADISQISGIVGRCDGFFHLAWEGIRGAARNDQEIQRKNLMNSISALKTAAKINCEFFVTSGSQAELGTNSAIGSESATCAPTCEYGKAKAKFLEFSQDFSSENGIRLIWARIFSLYGEFDFDGSLINVALRKMMNNEPVPLSPCTQMWNFMNVCDAAEAIVEIAVRGFHGIVNIADITSNPLRDYIIKMRTILNSESELKFGEIPFPSTGAVELKPDTSLMPRYFTPKILFEEGISLLLKGLTK